MDYKQFIEALKEDEALRAELAAFMAERKPESEEAGCAARIEFAAAKGYTVTVEDLSAAKAGDRELDDDELCAVTGGSSIGECYENYAKCKSTYTVNEWCLKNDSCSTAVLYYKRKGYCSSTMDVSETCFANDLCYNAWNLYKEHRDDCGGDFQYLYD